MALGRRKATERPASGEQNAPEAKQRASAANNALGNLLVDRGLVTQEKLDAAAERQGDSGKSITEVLVEMGAVAERDVVAAVGEQLGVPFVDLRRESPDAEVVTLLPEK